jgi:phenolic acid decarboxylase
MKTLHEFEGTGNFSSRKAIVIEDDNGDRGVQYLKNDQLIDYRIFPDHSEHYAESAAENWVLGVIKEIDLLVSS